MTGGLEIFNYYLSKGLADAGQNVWILTTCHQNRGYKNITNIKISRSTLINPTLATDVHIFLKLLRLRKTINVIHVPYTSNSYLVYPVLIINKIFNIPYVITIHGGGLHPWRQKKLHKLFFQSASAIVAVSETIKKEYEKRSGREIQVIPPIIPFSKSIISRDILRLKYGLESRDKIILSVGSIKKIKGSDILLDAFLNLTDEFIRAHNLRLIYVGDGNLRPELELKVRENNSGDHIKFFGILPYKAVSDMYALADIFVIPSLFEGKPIALLEAMFNGLPIIGADVNGINSIIIHGKNGLLFKKEDAIDLKNKIKLILTNMSSYIEMGGVARMDFSKTYQFHDVISKHVKLYDNIVGDEA